MIFPLILTIVFLSCQTILVLLELAPPRTPPLPRVPHNWRDVSKRGGVSFRARVGGRPGSPVRVLTFLPWGEM